MMPIHLLVKMQKAKSERTNSKRMSIVKVKLVYSSKGKRSLLVRVFDESFNTSIKYIKVTYFSLGGNLLVERQDSYGSLAATLNYFTSYLQNHLHRGSKRVMAVCRKVLP